MADAGRDDDAAASIALPEFVSALNAEDPALLLEGKLSVVAWKRRRADNSPPDAVQASKGHEPPY